MDDLISKLQNVLSDEESMKQIRELAGMLSGEGQQSSSPPPGSEASSPTSGGQGEYARYHFAFVKTGHDFGRRQYRKKQRAYGFPCPKLSWA